jgi:hypothetical protein
MLANIGKNVKKTQKSKKKGGKKSKMMLKNPQNAPLGRGSRPGIFRGHAASRGLANMQHINVPVFFFFLRVRIIYKIDGKIKQKRLWLGQFCSGGFVFGRRMTAVARRVFWYHCHPATATSNAHAHRIIYKWCGFFCSDLS